MDELSAQRYIMPIIVLYPVVNIEMNNNFEYCFVSSRKLYLFRRALLLDHILALKKLRVPLAYILFLYKLVNHFKRYNIYEQHSKADSAVQSVYLSGI